jgi:inosose dehydratase
MRKLQLGSCPDSWGVWFADDPRQTPWQRFLDEMAAAGYHWLELGPYGYLPTDPARLRDELAERGLTCAGGTVAGVGGPHKDFDAVVVQTRKVASLTAALGAKNLIFVPVPGYRDDVTGAYHQPASLDADGWKALTSNSDTLGRMLAEEYGLAMRFHPHADYHVETQEQTERYLEDTDPRYVSLCLDTGHLAYRRADVPAIIRKYPDRIGYVHIKQMDPAIAARAAGAVRAGGGAGRQRRAPGRTARCAVRPRGAGRAGRRTVRRRRAGHVPGRLRPAAADRDAYPAVPELRRPALHGRAVVMKTVPLRRET